jgi:hypothetical protein
MHAELRAHQMAGLLDQADGTYQVMCITDYD